MPNRYVRESAIESERVDKLSWAAEVFWRRLINRVDDFGRYTANPELLRASLFPLRLIKVPAADIGKWLSECETAGLVSTWKGIDGKHYLIMHRWEKGRAKASKYPEPPEGVRKRMLADANTCLQTQTNVSDPDPDPDPDPDCDLRARVDGKAPPAGGGDPPKAPTGIPQSDLDRALVVLNLYPSKAKKDGRPVHKSIDDQNLLAYRIQANPDYPWEEHARLMQANPTPPDLRKWVEKMPDPISLSTLRDATAKAAPATKSNFHLDFQPEDIPL